MKHSRRLANLPSYPFARWGERVSGAKESGLELIRLDMGNPDLAPPDEVIEALCQSARRADHHGYPGYRGIPTLRRAIANYYDRRFNVPLDPETEILPLIGSKEGLINLALAFLDPGDVALVPDPGYAPYSRGTILAGARPYTFPLLPEHSFLPDLDGIPSHVATEARLMWLNYPNNPTGATADMDLFSRALDFARHQELLLCHDAPYSDVTYDGYRAPSLLQVPGALEVAVEFNSLSKMTNMAGWRIGMAVGNAGALRALARVKSNVDSGIFHPLQEAAAAALATLSAEPSWLVQRNTVYRERLELLAEGLRRAGLEARRPQATPYLWVRIPDPPPDPVALRGTSEEFAQLLLEETGVAVAPGSFFGEAGEGFIRVSATAPTAQIQEAVRRLQAFDAPTSQSGR